mmetsp:Transcript_109375/g.353096  ORF Transcript_109375/g.353096 Transcript_109375/m.353096 type:complete len:237 (+) Transcript_109375:361-1071(+)
MEWLGASWAWASPTASPGRGRRGWVSLAPWPRPAPAPPPPVAPAASALGQRGWQGCPPRPPWGPRLRGPQPQRLQVPCQLQALRRPAQVRRGRRGPCTVRAPRTRAWGGAGGSRRAVTLQHARYLPVAWRALRQRWQRHAPPVPRGSVQCCWSHSRPRPAARSAGHRRQGRPATPGRLEAMPTAASFHDACPRTLRTPPTVAWTASQPQPAVLQRPGRSCTSASSTRPRLQLWARP